MLIKADRDKPIKKVDEKIKRLKSSKTFDAKKFIGKVSWQEDPLAWQKRKRDEWN